MLTEGISLSAEMDVRSLARLYVRIRRGERYEVRVAGGGGGGGGCS